MQASGWCNKKGHPQSNTISWQIKGVTLCQKDNENFELKTNKTKGNITDDELPLGQDNHLTLKYHLTKKQQQTNKNKLCMKSVISLAVNHHATYVNYALEMEKRIYVHIRTVIKLWLISLQWAHCWIGCCPPVVLLKYHRYVYKTNFVTHMWQPIIYL